MDIETYDGVEDWGETGRETIIQELYFIIWSICFAAREVIRWSDFKRDAQNFLQSGRTSRFVKEEGANSVLDKQTGQTWPMSIFQKLPHLDRAG
jgi:hypothetical protein